MHYCGSAIFRCGYIVFDRRTSISDLMRGYMVLCLFIDWTQRISIMYSESRTHYELLNAILETGFRYLWFAIRCGTINVLVYGLSSDGL